MESAIDYRPKLDTILCKALIEKAYKVKCLQVEELNGYDDKNYRVNLVGLEGFGEVCKHGYVFKVMNSLESKDIGFIEAQIEVLLLLSINGIKCPIPVPNINKQYYHNEEISGQIHVCRLLEFQPGKLFYEVPPTNFLLYRVGQFIANINNILKDNENQALKSRKSIWMLNAVPDVLKYINHIKCSKRVTLVEAVIEQFQTKVLSLKNDLKQGVIHGDFNEQNIVVDGDDKMDIVAVLDFGDMHFSCYLFEIAITMAYAILLTKNIDSAGYVLAGYSSVRDVSEQEISLLKLCIASRFVQSLVLGLYANFQDPSNTYVLTTQANGWHMLEEIWKVPNEELIATWKNCTSKPFV